jgi:2',3'-cyclic-nucleotide 2'-phosphodiesterase (5'-nucleotidase family)
MTPLYLDIFHTNDMHGRAQAMARLRSYVRRQTAELRGRGHAVLFWDAGDALDRRYSACSLTKGAAMAPVLNAMGYGLMTMGNDILLTFGPQAMADLVARLAFPVLAANARDGDSPPVAGLQEIAVVSLPGGLRLGVLGLTAPWSGLYEAFGLRFPDPYEVARRCVRRLQADGAKPIVALSHLGLADDLRLAEEVPGLRVIIGAHSHDVLSMGLVHHGVLIAQAGSFAERVGLVRLQLDASNGGVLSAKAEVMPIPENELPDADVLEALRTAEHEAEAVAGRPVAVLAAPLDLDYESECAMGDLLADALRERMGAQVALVIGAHLHSGLPAGMVTFGQVAQSSTSTANPQRTRVLGAQILAALEKGLDPEWSGQRIASFRGSPNGLPLVSGLEIDVDPTRPVGRRVVAVRHGGSPLGPEDSVLVAHTDGETIRGMELLELEPGQETEGEVPTVIREVLEDYLRAHSPVAPPAKDRWRVVQPDK